jgi:hypothetical protein
MMKALAGLAALAIIMAGSAFTDQTSRRHTEATVEVVESQSDEAPPYIGFDSNDWR